MNLLENKKNNNKNRFDDENWSVGKLRIKEQYHFYIVLKQNVLEQIRYTEAAAMKKKSQSKPIHFR